MSPADEPAPRGIDAEKDAAAARAVELVASGMTVGLGTGSTASFAVRRLGARVRGGLRVSCVPTSEGTRRLAEAEGIPLVGLENLASIDLAIDGADEADADLVLVKGGGGALLREKVVARLARQFVVIVDARKLVRQIGAFPLPVEVVPFARAAVARELGDLGWAPSLRVSSQGTPFLTDNGNDVLDCRLGAIADPDGVAATLDRIPGVVEHGLFIAMTDLLIVGGQDGVARVLRPPAHRQPRR
jgi:ribose 5-phosphate isomerase A